MNKVILMGRLTAAPELKRTANDISVMSGSLAVNRRFAAQGQERQADFINIVAWRQTAEFICKYFVKGQQIAIVGSIQSRNYTDKDNNKRTAVEVVVDEAYFADSKKDRADGSESGYSAPAPVFTSSESSFEEITEDSELPF